MHVMEPIVRAIVVMVSVLTLMAIHAMGIIAQVSTLRPFNSPPILLPQRFRMICVGIASVIAMQIFKIIICKASCMEALV